MPTIIHIGPHKTASSWFQKEVYPFVADHRLIDRALIRRTFLVPDAWSFDPKSAREAIGATNHAILCEEDLSGVLHNGIAATMIASEVAGRLHAALPEAQVVIFTRSQPAAAVSWYLQYLREGGTGSINQYLFPAGFGHFGRDRPFMKPHFDWGQLDYAGLVRRYDSLFGREKVLVLTYEDLVRDPQQTLETMERTLGIELPPPSPRRVNVGAPTRLIPLLRFANLFTRRAVVNKSSLLHIPYWYTVRKALFDRIGRWSLAGPRGDAETLLSPSALAFVAARFAASNRWLAERTGTDLAEIGYPIEAPAEMPSPPKRSPSLAWLSN